MNQGGNEDIRLLLIGGIAAMLLLFVSFLLTFIFTQRKKLQYQQSLRTLQEEKQRQLIEAAVQSEETERIRIAEELHDEVGALLSACKLYLRSFEPGSTEDANQELYLKGNELLDVAINKIRGIAQSLHSHILQEFGLNAAISHFAGRLTHGMLIAVTTHLDHSYVTRMPQRDISVYRIVQELLNNIIKHAQASRIDIASIVESEALTLTISHNGAGINQEQFEGLQYQPDGLGLKTIQNRVNLLKGKITFGFDASFYSISIYIPINHEYTES